MAKARIRDNKLKSFERNVRFFFRGRRTLIGNRRMVFALMNSFLAEHFFSWSLSLSLSPFPRSFLSDFRLLISVADAGIAGFSLL